MRCTTKAVAYTRVSTVEQAREGYYLAAQLAAIEQYCSINGAELQAHYSDDGISGKDIKHRPQLQALLQYVCDNQVDSVVVWALSRISRSVQDLYCICEMLSKHGCALVSITEAFDTSTPMGRACMGIIGVMAQLEVEQTSERVKLAAAERARQGKRTTNQVLGYDIDGKDGLVINEPEAEYVRYVFDKFLEHKSLSAVAELASLKGYCGKRGRPPRAWSVYRILTRPIYVGYNSFRGSLYPGQHRPIVSVNDYNKVQRLLGLEQIRA